MFAIGEAKSKVTNSKVIMPSEYRLKSKTLFGVWVGDYLLYISDETIWCPRESKTLGALFG